MFKNLSRKQFLTPGAIYLLGGIFIGEFILHPLTMIIYWFEFYNPDYEKVHLAYFIKSRFFDSFTQKMLPMNLMFVTTGAILGLFAWSYHHYRVNKELGNNLPKKKNKDFQTLITQGENEYIEFKSSVRWDFRHEKINKDLERKIIVTIAGFMNQDGGTLLIGVGDCGEIIGLEKDYQTLSKKNSDGFVQLLTSLISSRLGTHNCALVKITILKINRKEVCRLDVSSAIEPVYARIGQDELFCIRVGSSTRELNVREAYGYIQQHWA